MVALEARDTLEAMHAADADEARARRYHRRQFALTLVDLALGVVLLAWWSWSGAAARLAALLEARLRRPRGGRRGHRPGGRRLADPARPFRSTSWPASSSPGGRAAHAEPRQLARRSREGARHRGRPRAARRRDRLRPPPVEPGPVVALGERRPGGGDRAPGRRGPDLARAALLPADAARGPGAARADPRPRRPHGGAGGGGRRRGLLAQGARRERGRGRPRAHPADPRERHAAPRVPGRGGGGGPRARARAPRQGHVAKGLLLQSLLIVGALWAADRVLRAGAACSGSPGPRIPPAFRFSPWS